MGLLRFDPDSKAMYLASYHPGLSPQALAEATGFPLDTASALETPPPTEKELRILREEVDPERIFLK
jgi:glutaconate CoA-transferase subunit B